MENLFKLFLGLILASVFTIYLGYHLAYYQKIYPGISAAKMPLGNKNLNDAAKILNDQTEKVSAEEKLKLQADHQTWSIALREIEVNYETKAVSEKALMIGRGDDLAQNLKRKILAWTKGIDLPLDYHLNQEKLRGRIEEIASQIDKETIPPTLAVKKTKVELIPGQIGQRLDREKLVFTLKQRLARLDFSPISLPLVTGDSFPSPEMTENTKRRANNLLNKRLTLLLAGEIKSEIKDEDLIKLLSFFDSYDQEKIARLVSDLATTIDRPPENAAFQFMEKEKKVKEFRPAKEGKTVDQEKTNLAILKALHDLEAGRKEVDITIPVFTLPPAITNEDVNNLGLNQIIGKGVSYFKGSLSSRVHNIKLAASRLNGILIAPGETFSFNSAVGEISKATGYQEAYIIQKGRTILGDGGGVCQVSTTLFRAALNAGLPIAERYPHAYRVTYYEQNSAVGLDATVFAPSIDLKIKNNTSAYILIQTVFDLGKKMLAFELYGTTDGRRVTISAPRIWDQIPPPPDLYQDGPTLPAGTVKQIDWKAWGAKVAFDYQIERNGEILEKRTFFSAYRPWQAVYLRGTKSP